MQAHITDIEGESVPYSPFCFDGSEPFPETCRASGVRQNDRARWLEERRMGLGGSEVAALFGLHPYKSALEVYASKVGCEPENEAGEVALWGQLFEGPILSEYARRSGREVLHSNELLVRRDRPWHRCTPDAIQLTRPPANCNGYGIGEVKMTGYGDWLEEIPPHVLVQVQHELWVTGAEWGTLIWLPVPERKLQWRDMTPHREFQALLAEKCDEFWTRVLERRPPDADGSESAKRALFALEPELVDEVCEFDADAALVADELAAIQERLKLLEERKALISNRVMQALGPYKIGLLPDGRYWTSWRTAPRQEVCACGLVHRDVSGFRACRLLQPRKKPHGVPRELRLLDVKPNDELAKLLAASLEVVR